VSREEDRPWLLSMPAARASPLPQDRRGAPDRVLNIMRINNDLFCDLAAITVFDDTRAGEGVFTNTFLRYKNIPGLAIGHPAIIYDNVTDIYWMVTNLNRHAPTHRRECRVTVVGFLFFSFLFFSFLFFSFFLFWGGGVSR
jgi:hypothetical protein